MYKNLKRYKTMCHTHRLSHRFPLSKPLGVGTKKLLSLIILLLHFLYLRFAAAETLLRSGRQFRFVDHSITLSMGENTTNSDRGDIFINPYTVSIVNFCVNF
mmetsp:Transcript_33025/g.38790  ORF Transcript_33025/g.38790 Transcript_33025/m.38790 type:complete len:102 (+) Transcript_33025:25-330(+)